MIADFHIHYAPEKLVKDKLGNEPFKLVYSNGIPSYSFHPRLYQIEEHVKAMDLAGVDRAYISSAPGIEGSDLDVCRMINDDLVLWEKRFPSRIKGLAHIPPLGGSEAIRELRRAVNDLGLKGVAMASIVEERELDSDELYPFYQAVEELGAFLFIHPCLAVPAVGSFEDFDLARAVGREFNLVMGTIRLINGGILERFPHLKIVMSHLGGGIAALLGRVRNYQNREFWGTAGDPRHGKNPPKPFDYYLDKIYFDTGGFFGHINAVKSALLELKPTQLVFGTDYPQEIRSAEAMKGFVKGLKALGAEKAHPILSGTGATLIK
jgi:predicted TIM-barrel fold metal-dependent hydrolase